MMFGITLIVASLVAQDHILETRTRGKPWAHITGPSANVKAKLEAQKKARHIAAEQSRRDFDEALRILNSPPTLDCICQ